MTKWFRNTEAYVATGGLELPTRLRKATYGNDDEEPKSKHVDYIIACFEGKQIKVVTGQRAWGMFLERH